MVKAQKYYFANISGCEYFSAHFSGVSAVPNISTGKNSKRRYGAGIREKWNDDGP